MIELTRAVVALGEAAYIDADDEGSVPKGIYWRVTPGGAADLPAGPVLLRGAWSQGAPVAAADAATGRDMRPRRRVTRDAPVLLLPQAGPGEIVCWAHVQADGDVRVAAISSRVAAGGAYVELSARTRAPYDVAGHDMAGLVVTGEGEITEAVFYALPQSFEGDIGGIDGTQVHAMPDDLIPGHGYAVPAAVASWEKRVAFAAPYGSVPYGPDRPGESWSPDDELRRVDTIARAGDSVADWIGAAYGALGSGARGTVGAAGATGDPRRVVVRQAASSALMVASLDPGIARWLGRSGMIRHGAVHNERHGLLIATVPLHVHGGRLPVGATVIRDHGDALYDDLIVADGGFLRLLAEVGAWRPHPEFGPHDVLLAHIPLPYVTATTPARPVRPVVGPAPAPAGAPGGAGPRWAAGPPRRWEQAIAIGERPASTYSLHGPIPRGPVAFVRTDPAPPATLHPRIDGTVFAAPVVPGWDDETGVAMVLGTQLVPEGEAAGAVTWSLALSDWIGRWGESTEITLDPPAPPVPARPTIDAGLRRPAPTPPGAEATPPGQVHVRFRVPPAALPGALPLRRLTWTVDGSAQRPLDLTRTVPGPDAPALVVSADFPAPATVPGERRRVTVTAKVEDTAGTTSDVTTAEVDTSDARPVRPPTVAPRLLATSRRSGDASVSVTLTVRAAGNGAYRFYLASETALSRAAHLTPRPAATRAERARELNDATAASARQASMLALPDPVPVVGGVATARLDIPAGSVDVLAVRAVPVTAELDPSGRVIRDGVEAPFASVRPVFVVVPFDEVPPTPELRLTPAEGPGPASTPVKATVTVRGVPATVLGRYSGEPMQARFVEASTDGDPWFWPEIATTSLLRSPTDPGTFVGELTVDVPAWSRAGIAVAVRYPAEDTTIPGADVIDEPEFDASGPQGPRIESPWGPVSVPAWVRVAGAEPQISVRPDGGGGFRVRVAGLPALAPDAPTFRVDVYGSATGGGLVLLSESPVTDTSPEVPIPSGVVTAHPQLAAALVTPFGTTLPPVPVGTDGLRHPDGIGG
ncbi:hypothetical protein [Streptosporangium sandarakinum]|uniref:hypothetical protein n=1 Tax=Streptosporangium sandarakinum TaxID=1260955 RepID=UPI0033BC6B4A